MRLFKSRKGDLSLNTIVVAAIVMIVLVVLIMIYTGRMSIFTDLLGTTTKSCAGLGGKWCDSAACPDSDLNSKVDPAKDKPPANKNRCCPIAYFDTDRPC